MNKNNQHLRVKNKNSVIQYCYLLTCKTDLAWLMSELNKKFKCNLEAAHDFSRIYYDTFDWRLYQCDLVLFSQDYEQKNKLFLQDKDTATVKAIVALLKSNQSGSILDIPLSGLRDHIAPIIAMRALLPVVQVEGKMQTMVIRNNDDKIVVRLSVEQNCIALTKSRRGEQLPGRIVLEAIKGYLSEFRYVKKTLTNRTSLDACSDSQMDKALQSLGRKACDYSSKLNIKLDPSAQSGQAVKTVLQHLLAALNANEAGMLKNIDSEFLHDFRIAVRRVRSILSQMKGVLPRDEFDYFKGEFDWLGAVTTPARDIDVYLLEFDKLQRSLLPEMQNALLPFRDFLLERQQQTYADLVIEVKSKRYIVLKQALNKFIKSSIESYKNAPNAEKDIQGQANNRIWRSYRRVTKEADRLTVDSPAAVFHELRKSCKKLRYLLEFFQHLYPRKEMKELIQQLKILQDNLGEFQDMDVQSHDLHRFAKMMAEQGVNNPNTFMAMGVLVEGMEKKKNELRCEFGNCYKKFSRQRYQKIFDKLFHSVEKYRAGVN